MLLSITTITTLQIVCLLYILLILLTVLYRMYVHAIQIAGYSLKPHQTRIASRALLRLIGAIYALLLILIKAFSFTVTVLFFGHVAVTNICMFVFTITLLFVYFITYCVLVTVTVRSATKLQIVMLLQLYVILIWCLWASTTVFVTLLVIDSMSLVTLLLLIIDVQYDNNADITSGISAKLVGVSVYFWISFVATTLMLAGGLFLLGYAHSTNYGMLVLVSTFAVTTGSVNTTSVDIGLFLFIIGLVLKSGIGPFYIWKRYTFAAMRYSTLIIYTLVYFANIFLYTIYLIFVLFICSVTTIIVALSVVIVGTTFQLITTLETGIRVSDFFVISTVLNTALILCVVLVLCCTI